MFRKTLFMGLCIGVTNAQIYDLGKIEATDNTSIDNNLGVTTIKEEAIKENGAKDLAEAIKEAPGIFYQPSYSQRGEPSIGIRGYSSQHIGIFYDGIPIHSVYDRQTDLSQFSTFGISQINISKGYTSPIYGMNSLGGAINIVSSKPTKKLELEANYDFVSDNEHRIGTQIGQNFGKYYYQIGYFYVDRDSYKLSRDFKDTPYQKGRDKLNSYYTNQTFRGKVGMLARKNDEYSFNLIYQKGKKGGMLNAQEGGNLWNWPHYDKLTAYVLGRTYFKENFYLNSRIYYDSFDNELNSLGKMKPDGSIGKGYKGKSIYDDYTLGAIFDINYEWENQKLSAGINLKNDHHNSQDKFLDDSLDGDEERLSDITTSIFSQYSHDLEDFRFVISGSYDRNDMVEARLKDDNGKAKNSPKEDQTSWTLQGIVYYYLNDTTTLHANIGRKGKILTLKDRYSDTWGERVRNPDLEPETAINYELGATLELDKSTKISASIFYNDLTNMAITEPLSNNTCTAGSSCYRLINAKDGYSYGGELSLSKSFFEEKLNFLANYSFTKRKVENQNSNSRAVDGSRLVDYPEHIFNLRTKITPIKPLDFIAQASYHSKTYYPNATQDAWDNNGSVFLLDLRANYRFFKGFMAHIGAYNLLDKNYKYGSGYYMPGRRIFAGIEYKF